MLITDGVYSFSVFTYNCGLIEWDNGGSSTIGFNAAGQVYYNKNPTGIDLACINGNASVWSNVIYTLSMIPNIPVEPGIYNIYILLVLKNNALYHCLNDYTQYKKEHWILLKSQALLECWTQIFVLILTAVRKSYFQQIFHLEDTTIQKLL